MPPGARAYVYGLLSKQPVANLSGGGLIFQDKTVKGFLRSRWMQTKTPTELAEIKTQVNNLLKEGTLSSKT